MTMKHTEREIIRNLTAVMILETVVEQLSTASQEEVLTECEHNLRYHRALLKDLEQKQGQKG